MTGTRDFWTRRRAAVAAEEEAEVAEQEDLSEDAARVRLNRMTDAEVLEELNLKDPESLEPGDDFTVFMSRTVPDRIRLRALRALWRTNPVLANVDGLVDYGADFTDRAMVVENLQTAYQVGKGMLAHVEKLAVSLKDPSDEALTGVIADDPPEDAVEPDNRATVEDWEADEADQTDDMSSAPAPRRMVFVFEGGTG